ncbi:hypothetical protein C665_18702, partial [Thauera aminoaromatica S2]
DARRDDARRARHERAEQQRPRQPGRGERSQGQELRILRGGSLGGLGHLRLLHLCRTRLVALRRFLFRADFAHGALRAKMEPIRGVPLNSASARGLPAACISVACMFPLRGV